ncbi:MAG: TonB-dependent receptor [Bacteroidia bacterium]|nr:TonB-dependent receptor [Bacteroidia bacterium]
MHVTKRYLLSHEPLIYSVFLLCALSCLSLSAQRLDSLQSLEEMVVTGQYEANSLSKSVLKVKVIDAKRIESQGAFSLHQVLVNELNVRVMQDPVLGSNIQLQGVGGNNIKILIDGVPVIGRESGGIDLSQINLHSVERIELVEGPMSVNFGTDALGGVINIITKKQKANTKTARVGAYYESIGQANADMAIGSASGKNSILLMGNRNFFGGYSEDNSSRNKLWKPRTQYNAELSYTRFIDKGSFRFTNQFFTEGLIDRGVPNVDWTQASAIDKHFRTTRYTSSFFYDKKHDGKRNINVIAAYNGYLRRYNTYVKDLVSLEENLVPVSYEHDTNWFHQVMSRGTYANVAFSKKMSYQLGYEFNHEYSSGSRVGGNAVNMGDYNLFTSAELKPLKRLLLRPALRVIYHTKYQAPVVPSINFKYDFTEDLVLRGSYARGFRAPSLKELHLQFVDAAHNIRGNTNLSAETSDNFQLGFTYTHKWFNKLIRFEPNLFYNHIKDMIDLARVGAGNEALFQYVNINNFTSLGAACNLEYRTQAYFASLGYSLTGRKNELQNFTGTDAFFYAHEWRLNAGYNWVKQNLSLNYFCKLNGRMQIYQYNTLQNDVSLNYIDAFALMDVTMSKSFYKNRLSITTGLKNILNVINVNASLIGGVHSTGSGMAAAGMGRTGFIGVKYNFL